MRRVEDLSRAPFLLGTVKLAIGNRALHLRTRGGEPSVGNFRSLKNSPNWKVSAKIPEKLGKVGESTNLRLSFQWPIHGWTSKCLLRESYECLFRSKIKFIVYDSILDFFIYFMFDCTGYKKDSANNLSFFIFRL